MKKYVLFKIHTQVQVAIANNQTGCKVESYFETFHKAYTCMCIPEILKNFLKLIEISKFLSILFSQTFMIGYSLS